MPAVDVRYVETHTQDYGTVRTPYWEVDSGRPGPQLLIVCAQHGNEIQGAEAMRRFVAIAAGQLRQGCVRIVPFANRPALWKRRPHISTTAERPYGDHGGHNLNRTWPGRADGNDSERLTASLHDALVVHATHGIDIHCWERFTGATALPRKDKPGSLELARVSALPFVNPRDPPAPFAGGTTMLGALFNNSDRVSLTFELSGQYVIYEREVRWGLRAVLNVVKHLGMIAGEPEPPEHPVIWLDRAQQVKVTAPVNGLFARAPALLTASPVQEGQVLGYLLSDDDLATREIRAPVTGVLHSFDCSRPNSDVSLAAQHPYASAGDRLAVIAKSQP